MAGLYIHVPFCKQACHYCDFHFSTNQELRPRVVNSITKELSLQRDYLAAEPLATIYFGGGTPSILSQDELLKIVETIHQKFRVTADPEITLEANPDDLTDETLAALKSAGINRLSIGIQSFDDEILRSMNRVHDATQAIRSFAAARDHGFANISIDIMFGIPGQTNNEFSKNLDAAFQLSPEHLSVYCLTIEKKTAFGKWYDSGKLTPVSEDVSAEQYEMLMDRAQDAGYEHYEISNFSKPDFQSRHNSNYWRQTNYLGVGPSAHSYNGASRQYNVSNNSVYCDSIEKNIVPFEMEVLSRENKVNEYLFTSLRTMWGCDLEKMKEQFHFDLEKESLQYLSDLLHRQLAYMDGRTLKLTRAGKLLADRIASDLFVTAAFDS